MLSGDRDIFDERPTRSTFRAAIFGLLVGLILAFLSLLYAAKLRDYAYWITPKSGDFLAEAVGPDFHYDTEITSLNNNIKAIRQRLDAYIPDSPYLIIDTANNKIFLKNRKTLIHEGICSTGSFELLRASDDREWIFKTPRGRHRVMHRMTAPVWRKPDWAFVEEGRPIPPPDSPLRLEHGVLGKYAISFGYGYLIHGTPYKRMLGMPVTHGCVRLNDDDLEIVFKKLLWGSRVYIY